MSTVLFLFFVNQKHAKACSESGKRSIINHNSWHSSPSIIHIDKIECKINYSQTFSNFLPQLYRELLTEASYGFNLSSLPSFLAQLFAHLSLIYQTNQIKRDSSQNSNLEENKWFAEQTQHGMVSLIKLPFENHEIAGEEVG